MATLFPITRARRYIYKYTPPWYPPIDGPSHRDGYGEARTVQDDVLEVQDEVLEVHEVLLDV